MGEKVTAISGGRLLSKNVSWNLFGAIVPLPVAIITIPILIENIGTARFGVLTIIWMVVGYFSLFDLGLGRALTKLVASNIGKEKNRENPKLIWTAMSMMGGFGLVGFMVLVSLSNWLVTDILNVLEGLKSESLTTFYLLSVSIPIVITSIGLRGVLEAYQCFKFVNLVRIPVGVFTFLGPTLVLPFSNSLVPIVIVLIIVRLMAWIAYIYLSFRIVPALKYDIKISWKVARSLLGFGSWMTVTNIVGPLMVYMDRFIIGATLSMAAVAFYATPYEVVTKLWVISGALMSVLFPAFSAGLEQDHKGVIQLFNTAIKYLFIVFFPITIVIITFSYEALAFWIDNDFANNSSIVLQLLVLGVFINAHAQVPFAMIQGAGRPDITAKLHLIELPFYLLLLVWMLDSYGIVGAALTWVIRIIFDSIILFGITSKVLSRPSFFSSETMLKLSVVFGVLAVGFFITDAYLKLLFTLVTVTVFFIISWYYLLTESEKNVIRATKIRIK